MSPSAKIFVGLFAGIFVGLFFGEDADVLRYGEQAFVLLLQMTVLPYIVVSLISGLGNLSAEKSKELAKGAGTVLLIIWVLALTVVLGSTFIYPLVENANFFSTSMVEAAKSIDIISLYIPANPFNAMATNVVPATVLFSISVGLAIMNLPSKEKLIEPLHILQKALAKITNEVTKLTPYGMFAIAGRAAGTMNISELKQLQTFIIVYIVANTVLAYWVFPQFIATFTPISYKKVVNDTKAMMLTAFMTGNLMVILPSLSDFIKELLRGDLDNPTEEDIDTVDVIVTSSFNFPNAGKLLLLLFIVFAAWFSGSALGIKDLPSLGIMGLITLFGSANVAFPFLLDLFKIPQDMFQLYISLSVITARFATLLAAMSALTLGIIGSYSLVGLTKKSKKNAIRFFTKSFIAIAIMIVGLKLLFTLDYFKEDYVKDKYFVEMKPVFPLAPKYTGTIPIDSTQSHTTAKDIVNRGVLSVAFLPEELPYAYKNNKGIPIGLDIDMANKLANELGVKLKITKYPNMNSAVNALNTKEVDIIMSGTVINPDLSYRVLYSTPYLEETYAFLTKDYLLDKYQNINANTVGTINVPNSDYYINMTKEEYPSLKIIPTARVRKFLRDTTGSIDALFFTAERGSAWSLIYPQFSVAIPKNNVSKVPLAYIMKKNNIELKQFIDNWIELKKASGAIDKLYNHWILGKDAIPYKPRWCIKNNVLHWDKKLKKKEE